MGNPEATTHTPSLQFLSVYFMVKSTRLGLPLSLACSSLLSGLAATMNSRSAPQAASHQGVAHRLGALTCQLAHVIVSRFGMLHHELFHLRHR